MAAVLLTATTALGGGVVDVELPNRAKLTGRLDRPAEIETYRMRLPAGASVRVVAAGLRGGPRVSLTLFDEGGGLLGGVRKSTRRGEKVSGVILPAGGLIQIDVKGDGVTGDYKLKASWTVPKGTPFEGTAGTTPATVTFVAEAGAVAKVVLRARMKGATGRVTRLDGPANYAYVVPLPLRPKAKHRVAGVALPFTGTYTASVVTSQDGVPVTGKVIVKAPKGATKSDTRGAERRGIAGTTHLVTRHAGPFGTSVEVPELADTQRVSIDNSGVVIDVPQDALAAPTIITVATDDEEIADPLGFAPAGVVVDLDAEDQPFAEAVTVSLPYDVGAFPFGADQDNVCLLKRTDDGTVFELPPASLVIDEQAGTVSAPTGGFSAFQVFAPPIELAVLDRPGRPNDLSVPYGEDMLYLSTDILSDTNPAAAILRQPAPGDPLELFAGGGFTTADWSHRLDFDFDADLVGLAFVTAVHAAPGGYVVVVTSDLAGTASLVYLIWPDDTVLRVAGNGTAQLNEALPARLTGLPHCCAAEVLDGDLIVLTDAYPYPESDRVLRIDLNVNTPDEIPIETIAGGGFADVSGFAPLDTRLYKPRAMLVDLQSRILVGDVDWLLRFDLAAGTTETLAGTNFGETDPGDVGGRALAGQGAPLRTVVTGALDDLAFVPGTEDIVLAADPASGIVWRFDLARDRAWVAAGRRLNFSEELVTRDPDDTLIDPSLPLNFPVAVAPRGEEIYIAELFDDRLLVLRPVGDP